MKKLRMITLLPFPPSPTTEKERPLKRNSSISNSVFNFTKPKILEFYVKSHGVEENSIIFQIPINLPKHFFRIKKVSVHDTENTPEPSSGFMTN